MLNFSQWSSLGRHAVSFVAGGTVVFSGLVSIVYNLHGLNADQFAQLTSAGKVLADGVTNIAGAIGTIASISVAAWAAYQQSAKAKTAAVASIPGTVVVTNPKLAAGLPDNVVSNATNQVVPVVPSPEDHTAG